MEARVRTKLRKKTVIQVAETLPPRLLKFFAVNPPWLFRDRSKTPSPPSSTVPGGATTEPAVKTVATTATSLKSLWRRGESVVYLPIGTSARAKRPPVEPPTPRSPFLPHKNPVTGRWHPPIYSLRRQAELFKLAREHDVEELLPFSVKSTQEKLKRREEHGLRLKGTGVGQTVKGHKWERTLKGRLDKRRKAMMDMPRMINEWKRLGHGRNIKKWPSGKAT